MADKELSDLTSASTLDGTELTYIVQSGNSRKVAASEIPKISHTQPFSTITSTPTTLDGYGITDAATSAQGAKADSAVQPADLATVATTGAYSDLSGLPTLGTAAATDADAYATAAQGTKADSSLQPGDIGDTVQGHGALLDEMKALAAGADGQVVGFSGGNLAVITASGGGDMLASANLSDLADVSTARTNLGLGTAATADTGDFATAAQGAKADSAVQSTATDASGFGFVNTGTLADSDTTVPSESTVKDAIGALGIPSPETDKKYQRLAVKADGSGFDVFSAPVSQYQFGAAGDAEYALDGAITAGDKTFTSASASFAAADVGKLIFVGGAGASAGSLATTIASVTSTTSIELTDAAGTTVSDAPYCYGTDDTDAIKTVHTFCEATGIPYHYMPGGHIIRSTVTVASSGDMSAAIFYADALGDFAGSTDKTVLRLGSNVADDRIWRLTISTPQLTNGTHVTGDAWAGYDDVVGLEKANLNYCKISQEQIAGFGVGVWEAGYTAGLAYVETSNKAILNCKTGLLRQPGDTGGWVNQTVWIGGKIGLGTGEDVSGTALYKSALPASATNSAPNNHTLDGVAFEGIEPEYVAVINGRHQHFDNCRWEVGGTSKIHFVDDAQYICVDGGWNSDKIEWSDNGGTAIYLNGVMNAGRTVLAGLGQALDLQAVPVAGADNNVLRVFPFGTDPLQQAANSKAWTSAINGSGFLAKLAADLYARVKVDADGVHFGDGTADASFTLSGGQYGITSSETFYPLNDNQKNLGLASFRWANVYAATGSIQTSDGREKEWRGGLNEAELSVAKKLGSLIGIYRWKSAIDEKGDAARLHCGVTAQDVIAAFREQGLDAFAYSVCCHDNWDAQPAVKDKDGNVIRPALEAGDRYGVRYDELWAFVAVGFEARLAALEKTES